MIFLHGLFEDVIFPLTCSIVRHEYNRRNYTDLLMSNFHGKKLCGQAVMYIFEWHFRME